MARDLCTVLIGAAKWPELLERYQREAPCIKRSLRCFPPVFALQKDRGQSRSRSGRKLRNSRLHSFKSPRSMLFAGEIEIIQGLPAIPLCKYHIHTPSLWQRTLTSLQSSSDELLYTNLQEGTGKLRCQ